MSIALHPAVVECRRLGERGALASHELSFVLNVMRILERTTESRRTAASLFGIGDTAFQACCDLAGRQERDDLTMALARYNAALANRSEPCLFTMTL